MKRFYVRPQRAEGYGAGDGSSYENAWNGLAAVEWSAMEGEPAQLWVCGDPQGRPGFMTVFVEWSYIATAAAAQGTSAASPDPRRESSQPV
jgi:hypothetical protein